MVQVFFLSLSSGTFDQTPGSKPLKGPGPDEVLPVPVEHVLLHPQACWFIASFTLCLHASQF